MNTLIPFKYSPVESNRFGLKVYRGLLDDINPDKILYTILKENIDVAIFRIPAERQESLFLLEKTGFPYLLTDTLVYYHVDLKTCAPNELRNENLKFIEFAPQHFEIMDKLVTEIFPSYKNHYTSNPILSINLINAYKEWARNFVTNVTQGKYAWLIKQDDLFIGFALCSFKDDESEGVLYGIIPSYSGKGVYGDLIRFTQRFFKKSGFSTMKISTQVNNYAVQKVWSREGFVMKQAFLTIHINSLMSASQIEKKTYDFTFSKDDVMKFGKINSKTDLVYLDNDFALKKEFAAKIIPDIFINSIISRYYTTEFPGDGTLCINYSYKFLKPIYLNKLYRLEISFPLVDTKKGIYKSLAKILDANGELYLFAYNNLVKK